MAIALVTTFAPKAGIHAAVRATPLVRVGQRVTYRVTATGGGKAGATSVRLCTRAPRSLISVRAPGTIAFHGLRCRTTAALGAGRSLSFTVSGLASARGHVFPFARATAVDVARPAHAVTRVIVLGPLACPAIAGTAKRPKPPLARAAC
jgi:hypothetical protein